MKALLIDVYNNTVTVQDPETLEDWYQLIDCKLVEIASRRIGYDRRFNIICDEEGCFRQDAKISAIDSIGCPMLVGNLLIVGDADADGELLPLDEYDIAYLTHYIHKIPTLAYPDGYMMLTQCSY